MSPIAVMNDCVRKSIPAVPRPHQFMISHDVALLPHDELEEVVEAVRTFDLFTPGDDPYGEHDFGKVTVRGSGYFWKIDYYDDAFENHQEDGNRVLLVMATHEY